MDVLLALQAVGSKLHALGRLEAAWAVPGLVLCAFGALEYRRRGGLFGDFIRAHIWDEYQTTAARLLFALTTSAWASVVAHDALLLLMLPAMYLGLVMGWFEAADVGRDGDRSRLVEFLIMTGRGLLMTAPSGAVALFLGHPGGVAFGLSGLLMGLAYELGQRTPSSVPEFQEGIPVAEVYWGFALWASVLVSFGVLPLCL